MPEPFSETFSSISFVGPFDETNKKVGENYVTINRDGTFSIRSKEKFKDYWNHVGCMDGAALNRVKFFWIFTLMSADRFCCE